MLADRGTLDDERLLSGLRLDGELARRAVTDQVATPLGLSLEEAAHGVFLLGCARMARAVRAVTVERGRDPREFSLVAFGGNGPLFAAEMAAGLGIGTVVVWAVGWGLGKAMEFPLEADIADLEREINSDPECRRDDDGNPFPDRPGSPHAELDWGFDPSGHAYEGMASRRVPAPSLA